jgi:hypothetical protein
LIELSQTPGKRAVVTFSPEVHEATAVITFLSPGVRKDYGNFSSVRNSPISLSSMTSTAEDFCCIT